jgi:zinc protease
MRRAVLVMTYFLLPLLLTAPLAGQSFFPYEVHRRTLPNQLDVVVIPTPEFRNVVSFNTLILAGSRNEVEKGRSGLAHLFEHILFRHKFDDPEGSYGVLMEQLGAFNNAWTWFDVTYYHPLTFAENLEQLVALEADRFVNIDFTERIYRTEAGAVLGEYRRIASDPSLRMDEVLSDLAFGPDHGYGHTTIGYLEDIMDMPNSYRAGVAFYETWYRPNNAVVIVSGDVDPERVFQLVEKHFGGWQPRALPELPAAGPVNGPKRGHVDWEADVPPRITFAYAAPPFDPASTDGAVVGLLPELISGQTAPLFQRLRYQDQDAVAMFTSGQMAQGFDRRMLETFVTLDKAKFDQRGLPLLREVEEKMIAGFDELKNFSQRPAAARELESLKSKYRYDLLGSIESPANAAERFAWYYRFGRDPNVFDTLMAAIERLTPEDIDAFARRQFVPERRVVVTMTPRGAAN